MLAHLPCSAFSATQSDEPDQTGFNLAEMEKSDKLKLNRAEMKEENSQPPKETIKMEKPTGES